MSDEHNIDQKLKRAADQAIEHARNWRKGRGNKSPRPKPKAGAEAGKKDLQDA